MEETAIAQNAVVDGEVDKEALAREKAAKQREVQALTLNRARIAEQMERSGSERYQQLLRQELEHIDKQLAAL